MPELLVEKARNQDIDGLQEVMKALGIADVGNIVGAEDLSPVITTMLARDDMNMFPLLRRMEAKYGKGKEVKLLTHTWREKNLIAQANVRGAKFDPESEPAFAKGNYIKRNNHVMALGYKVGVGLIAQKEAAGFGVTDLLSSEANDRMIDIVKSKDYFAWNGILDATGPAFECRGLKAGLLNCSASNIVDPVNGSLRALTQTMLDTALQAQFESGSTPTCIYVSSHYLASQIAGFTNNGADKISPQIIINNGDGVAAGTTTMSYASNATYGVRIPIVVAMNLGYKASGSNAVKETINGDEAGLLAILAESLIQPVWFLPMLQLEAVATSLTKNQYILEVGGWEDRHSDSSAITAHALINMLSCKP